MHATCLAHTNMFGLLSLIMYGEEYRLEFCRHHHHRRRKFLGWESTHTCFHRRDIRYHQFLSKLLHLYYPPLSVLTNVFLPLVICLIHLMDSRCHFVYNPTVFTSGALL